MTDAIKKVQMFMDTRKSVSEATTGLAFYGMMLSMRLMSILLLLNTDVEDEDLKQVATCLSNLMDAIENAEKYGETVEKLLHNISTSLFKEKTEVL